VSQYTAELSLPGQPKSSSYSGKECGTLSLNELVRRKRLTIATPIPRYSVDSSSQETPSERERHDSFTIAKEEVAPEQQKLEVETSPVKRLEPEENKTKTEKTVKKLKSKSKDFIAELAFDNEKGELATRCDVVYKTLLRDFRRFFLDSYKASKAEDDHDSDLSSSLLRYTTSIFPEVSADAAKTLSLDLGCLLFPKEMRENKIIVGDLTSRNHFSEASEDLDAEIMKIHSYLYKFSIDKIEECFKNSSLCQLFLFYTKAGKDRILENITMKKNHSVYLKARGILEGKAIKSLCG